jgi:hypothetical protein
MHFPSFWTKEECQGAAAWGWSSSSKEEAAQNARQRAVRIAKALQDGNANLRHSYGYEVGPLREQVLASYPEGTVKPSIVITRNPYGARVLNTARVMFIDIDSQPEAAAASGSSFFRKVLQLFSGSRGVAKVATPSSPAKCTPRDKPLERVRSWARANPNWGIRVYRTAAGLRLLITQAEFDPLSESTSSVMQQLGVDPLYLRLCKNQKSFRARLTPKPWRVDLYAPPSRWPWPTERAEKRFADWEEQYRGQSANYASCQFVEALGSSTCCAAAAEVLRIHDAETKAQSGLALA